MTYPCCVQRARAARVVQGAGSQHTCRLLEGPWTSDGMAEAIKGLCLSGDKMTGGWVRMVK